MSEQPTLVPIEEVISSVAELGFAGRNPVGFPGATAVCQTCGGITEKWSRIWSVLVGECCFGKIVTDETPRRICTTIHQPRRPC